MVYSQEGPVALLDIMQGHYYRIGRGKDADCRVPDDGISRLHLAIDTRSRPWQLVDLGSKNGSRLAGKPLDRADIDQSCWLSLAGIPARLEIGDEAAANAWHEQVTGRYQTARMLGGRLSESFDSDRLLERTLDSFLQVAECETGALVLIDTNGQPRLRKVVGNGISATSQQLIERAMHTGQSQVVSDTSEARAAVGEATPAEGASVVAMVCVPLMLGNRVRGLLHAESTRRGKLFTELDLELLEGLARQGAFALALSRIQGEVAELKGHLPHSPEALESSSELSEMIERLMPAAHSH
jgi:GAF domain-containing protein